METKEINEMLENALKDTMSKFDETDNTLFAITCKKDEDEEGTFRGDCYLVGHTWKLAEGFFQLLLDGFSRNADNYCYGVVVSLMLGIKKMLECDGDERDRFIMQLMTLLKDSDYERSVKIEKV